MTSRNKKIAVAITGAIAFLIPLMTSAPGLSWLDAGDFVTAASTLGVPHPTGFPVYTLLGHLFSYLPLGNQAMRVALPSAVFSGITALCLLSIIANHADSTMEVVGSGLALIMVFVGAPTVYLCARVPEVYALNCALSAGCLLCLARWLKTEDVRWGYGLAIIAGLGLANHALFRLFAPVFFVAFFAEKRHRTVGIAVAWLLLLALALLAYLYLPAAALRHPQHNWGDPSSLSRFWGHVNALEIRRAFSREMAPTPFTLQVYSVVYFRQIWSAIGPLFLFGLTGLAACLWRTVGPGPKTPITQLGSLTGCLVAAETAYAVAVNPMGLRDYQNGQLSTLLLAVAGSVFLLKMLHWFAVQAPRLSQISSILSVFIVPLGLAPFMDHDFYGIERDWSVEDLAVIHTSLAEPEAITTLVSDSLIAAHLYVDVVLDARPDMAILGRNQFSNSRRFAYSARQQPSWFLDAQTLRAWENSEAVLTEAEFVQRAETIVRRHLGGRIVYFETHTRHTDLPDSLAVLGQWPVGRVVPAGQRNGVGGCEPGERSYCGAARDVSFARGARDLSGSGGVFYRNWLADKWGSEGKKWFSERNYRAALTAYLKSADLAPDRAAWRTNIAVCFAALGHLKQALAVVEEAIELDPLSKIPLRNGMLYARALGDQRTLERLEAHAARLQF